MADSATQPRVALVTGSQWGRLLLPLSRCTTACRRSGCERLSPAESLATPQIPDRARRWPSLHKGQRFSWPRLAQRNHRSSIAHQRRSVRLPQQLMLTG